METKYHYKPEELLRKIAPEEMGLEYTSVQRLEFAIELEGGRYLYSGEEELCLACIEGQMDFECSGQKGTAVLKDMLYIPCKTGIKLKAGKSAVMMCYGAPSELDSRFVHIKFTDVNDDKKRHHVYGNKEMGCLRHVWNFIDDTFNASRLLMGLCAGESGGWTAWPPHEHAKKREEVYVYFNMGDAFGIQCVYEDMKNPLVVAMVGNGDMVSVPRGYHPSTGCPAGGIFYIYCMVSKKPGDRAFMDLNIQSIYGGKFE